MPDQAHANGGSPYSSLPRAPRPSQDAGIKDALPDPSSDLGSIPSLESLDLGTLSPYAALKLLTSSVDSIVCEEGKTLPTPPISSPTSPKLFTFEHVGSGNHEGASELPGRPGRQHSGEVPTRHKTPIGSPEVHPHDPANASQPTHLSIDEVVSEYDRQCIAMARAFHCKVPPPITLQAYLRRIHHYCCMSTAVYLAAACYIQRITHGLWAPRSPDEVYEGGLIYVQITPRSVHRLVLAALRVAHKALEDNTWTHSRFAGVGGVPPANLTRIELALCYLLDFRLFCSKDQLSDAARWMIQGGDGAVPDKASVIA